MMAMRSSRRRLKVTPCFAQAAVPTMLWNAIPTTMDSIMGLNVVIPGSIRMAKDAPATIEVRKSPGRISRAFPPVHRRVVETREAPMLSFSGSASLLAEIRVTSWLRLAFQPNIGDAD
jgi:hypothetical protein